MNLLTQRRPARSGSTEGDQEHIERWNRVALTILQTEVAETRLLDLLATKESESMQTSNDTSVHNIRHHLKTSTHR